MENISITSSKGHIAATVHESPEHTKLAVLCPGYLDSKDYPHLVALADELTKVGYDAVRFNPTGTWDSEGTIADFNITQQLIDFRSVIEYMLSKKDYESILVGGHSRGGLVAILYAEQDARVSKILAIMPPQSVIKTANSEKVRKWKEVGYRESIRDIPGSLLKEEFKVPYSDAEDSLNYSVLNTVTNITIPTIFVTGELDTVVPPNDVREIFEQANDPKKLIVLENIAHDYRRRPEEINIVNQHIIEAL